MERHLDVLALEQNPTYKFLADALKIKFSSQDMFEKEMYST